MTSHKGFFSKLFGADKVSTAVVEFSAGSSIGSRRQNQDNLRAGARVPHIRPRSAVAKAGTLELRDTDVFCVCDGIGGGYRGELAAKYALKAIRRYLKTTLHSDIPLRELVLEAAENAHQEVCAFYRTVRAIGGCTLVMAAVRGGEYAFLNIGDSPGFLIPADGQICELSCRHNMAWEKLRMDIPAERNDSNRLLRYLGMADTTAEEIAYVTEGFLKEGDWILLCTDGVTNTYPLPSLERAIRSGLTAAEIAAAAGRAKGADNCTAVCLRIREILTDPRSDSEQAKKEEPAEPIEEYDRERGDRDDTGTEGTAGGGDHAV